MKTLHIKHPSKELLKFMRKERKRSIEKYGEFKVIDPEQIKKERSDAYDYMF